MKELWAVRNIIDKSTGQEKSQWKRIGVGFLNKDGSYNLVFDFVPANFSLFKIQLREPTTNDNQTH